MIIIIPSYNFIEGIKWNLEFINKNYKFDFKAIIVDNMSTNQNDIIKLTKSYNWCSFVNNPQKNNLRKSLQLGKEFSDSNNGEIIHIVETDAILNMNTIILTDISPPSKTSRASSTRITSNRSSMS